MAAAAAAEGLNRNSCFVYLQACLVTDPSSEILLVERKFGGGLLGEGSGEAFQLVC